MLFLKIASSLTFFITLHHSIMLESLGELDQQQQPTKVAVRFITQIIILPLIVPLRRS